MSIDEIRATYYASKVHSELDKQNDLRQQLIEVLTSKSDNLKAEYNISDYPGESVKATYKRLQTELTTRHKLEQDELSKRRIAANMAKKAIDSIKSEISMLT